MKNRNVKLRRGKDNRFVVNCVLASKFLRFAVTSCWSQKGNISGSKTIVSSATNSKFRGTVLDLHLARVSIHHSSESWVLCHKSLYVCHHFFLTVIPSSGKLCRACKGDGVACVLIVQHSDFWWWYSCKLTIAPEIRFKAEVCLEEREGVHVIRVWNALLPWKLSGR